VELGEAVPHAHAHGAAQRARRLRPAAHEPREVHEAVPDDVRVHAEGAAIQLVLAHLEPSHAQAELVQVLGVLLNEPLEELKIRVVHAHGTDFRSAPALPHLLHDAPGVRLSRLDALELELPNAHEHDVGRGRDRREQ